MNEITSKITLEILLAELKHVKSMLSSHKVMLTVDDFSAYTGFSKESLYKLVHSKSIPFYKPTRGKIFFKKTEIDAWLLEEKG